LIPSVERTPVTLGEIFGHGVYPLVVRALAATVIGMALPMSYEPDPVPPKAEPGAIRACLTGQMLAIFDREWDTVMEEARRSHDLAGIEQLLLKWRQLAYSELKDPGSYARMLAKADLIRRTGGNPDAVPIEDVRELIRQRLGA
jgi:hypothetical protein